ncbi:MAG: hypothetical protein NTY13_00460 [Chlamydiae bacterium]|nr:hypothetical protein [Chlamydiota bacterium]
MTVPEKRSVVSDLKEEVFKNPKGVVLTILALLGLILSYYWIGGLVLGVAAGFFIPGTIKDLLTKAEDFYKTTDKVTLFIASITVVFFIFHTFWFVVGAVVPLTIKLIFPKAQA